MSRTSAAKVTGILKDNYGPLRDASLPSVEDMIETAGSVTTDVLSCATRRKRPIDVTKAELIERWLAAWFYTKSDPMYSNRMTGRASGSFIVGPVEPEYYKDAAMALDPCVAVVINHKFAGGAWAGRNRIAQTDLEDRA